MMSRFVTNYLGVNSVNPGQPQHPQQPHPHGLPMALTATLNQQQHQPPQQQQSQQQQQSLQQQQQQQTQHQMKNPNQSHSEHYSTPVMGQVQVQQTQQQMHGPNSTAPHYRIMSQAAPPPNAVYQQNAGPMQGPPQSQQSQQQQQITTTTIRGIPPSSSTPPQQPDVLGKMGQQPSHYQMQQIQQPQQQQSAPQQSRNGSYRPQSNINNRNRMNPQQPPLYFPYPQQFVMNPLRHPSFASPQFQQLYYYPSIPSVSQRAGTPASNLVQQTPNITASAQPNPHIPDMYPSYEMYQPMIGNNTPIQPANTTTTPAPKKEKLRPNAIAIINPDTNRNVVLDFLNDAGATNAPSNASSSGVSSAGSANTSATAESGGSPGSNSENTTIQQQTSSSSPNENDNVNIPQEVVAGQQPILQPAQQAPLQKREHNQPQQIRMQQPPPPQYVHQMRENSQGRETMHPHHGQQHAPPSHQPIFDGVPVYQQPPPQIPYQIQTDLSQQSQTPVVSAISDGPSVDITPKHGSKKKNKLNEHAGQNENMNKQHQHSVVSHNQVPPPVQTKQQHHHHPQQIPQQQNQQQINYNKNKPQSQQQPILPTPQQQQQPIPLIQHPQQQQQQPIKVDSYKPVSAPSSGKESTIPQIPQKTQKEIEESDLDNNNTELANVVEATTEDFANKLTLKEDENKKNNNFIEETQQAPSVDVAVEQKNKKNDMKAQESQKEVEEKRQVTEVVEETKKVPDSDETDRAVQMMGPPPSVDIVKQQIDLKNNNKMSSSSEKVEIQLPKEEAKVEPIVEVSADVDVKPKPVEATPSAADTILNYNTDQWSPLNSDGKKYYTRDQLLVLKEQPISKHKPFLSGIVESLFKPNINVLRKTLESDMIEIVQNDQLMKGNRLPNIHEMRMSSIEPKFGLNPRPAYQKRPSNNANKIIQAQRLSNSGPQINIRLSLKEDVKLNEAEVAWKPTHLTHEERMAGEADKQTQELYKKFRSVLNKLTPDNFGVLMKQVKLLDISTEEQLNGCIKLVFEKAISEPNFATAYAMMCKEIGTMYVPISAEKKTMFKNKLINQCQVEFERHKDDSKLRNRTEKIKEIENEKNTEKRDELKAIFDEEDFKLRKRAVGTVKFIGELYKIDMLTSKIMRSCVGVLLGEDIISEDTLECLCKLLTTIGQKMEKQEDLQDNFNKLRSIIDKKQQKISSRIRFMIQDVIDLRKNNWTPRRADLKPKTIEQIQKDVENEQFNNQMLNYQSSQQRKDDNRRGGNSGQNNYNKRMGGGQGGGGGGGDDAWLTQQNSKRSSKLLDMKNITITSNLEPKTMGSPSLFQSFNCYNALAAAGDDVGQQNENNKREAYNSKGSSMERDRGDMRDRFYTGDRYGSQSGGRNSNQGSRNGSQIRSRENSGSRAGGNMAAGGSRSLQPPPHRHQQSSSSSSQTLMSSSSGNMVRSGSQYKDQPQSQQQQQQQQQQKTSMPPPQQPVQKQSSVENKPIMRQKQPPMTEAEVTKSTTAVSNIIKNLKDRLSAEDALDKMSSIRMNEEVLTEAYNLLLDRRDQERYIFCDIMTQLIRKNTVSNDDNVQALKVCVDQAKDLICDLPHIYLYIAQFLAIYVCENILSCKDILYISESECSSEKGGEDILQKLFKTIESKYDKKRLCEVFENANVDLKLFIANKDINQFLGKYEFEYLLNKEVVKPQKITDVNQISAEIKRLLKRNAEFDSIFDWINTNVESTQDFNFIRALTTTVIEHCVEKSTMYKLNISLLHKLLPVLQKYIDNNESLELQCLYAIQKLIVKLEFPQGLLNNIFSELYDNGVLSSEGFRKWEMSDDPYEQEGKGVILKNCTQFFTMLSEEGESSCEED